jgi:hypothetical protein
VRKLIFQKLPKFSQVFVRCKFLPLFQTTEETKLEKNKNTDQEHGLVDRVDKVAAGLHLVQCESSALLVIQVLVLLVLQEHPVAELHVVAATWVSMAAAPRFRHPPVLER